MMKKQPFIYKIALCITAIVVMLTVSHVPMMAQDNGPEGYCTPESYVKTIGTGYAYYMCYPYYYPKNYPTSYERFPNGTVSETKVYSKTDPTNVPIYINHGDNFINCYQLFLMGQYTGEGEMAPGETYVLQMRLKPWGYKFYNSSDYCTFAYYNAVNFRAFIDWNMDADWADNLNTYKPENEFINQYGTRKWGGQYVTGHCDPINASYEFTVPENVETKKTRMRLICTGYPSSVWRPETQYETNACIPTEWYIYDYGGGNVQVYSYDYAETVDYVFAIGVALKGSFPSAVAPDNILLAGEKYNGETRRRLDKPDDPAVLFKRPMVKIGSALKEGTILQYQIFGPLPLGSDENKQLVYEALDPKQSTANPMIDVSGSKWPNQLIIPMTKSRGIYSPGGDGTFKATSGGEYQLRLTLTLPGKPAKVIKSSFIVAWANDLTASSIESPLTDGFPRYFKYARGITMDAIGTFTNTGLNPVYKFDATCKVFDTEGALYFEKTYTYDYLQEATGVLNIGQKATVKFGSFKPDVVGQYKMYITCNLLSANDNEAFNDRFMRVGEPDYTFALADEYEAQATESVLPGNGSKNIVINRPFFPIGDFTNNGISDIANAYAKMEFKCLSDNTVTKTDVVIESLPQAPKGQNTRSVKFPSVVLKKAGMYEGTMTIKAVGDRQTNNDVIKFNFEVINSLKGEFTVGNGGDYASIDEAMNSLYKNGIDGPITLILIDKEYNVGDINNAGAPAWDFSSSILGHNKINNITIKPSKGLEILKGSITINLFAGNGQGVLFGQSKTNKYPDAIINEELTSNLLEKYANNAGYITIDGGKNKSMKFILHSAKQNYGTAFCLNQGSQNITITNVLIENATEQIKNSYYLPGTYYNKKDGNVFEKDINLTGQSYSAGILNRAKILGDDLPEFGIPQEESTVKLVFDIVPNSNNTFTKNEISGFGYGVLSLGMGPVSIKDPKTDLEALENRYNQNTLIEDNTITASGSTGIFLGYEENASVSRNTINDVTNSSKAAGIVLGGGAHDNYPGYNNVNTKVINNRISSVNGGSSAEGIRVEQSHNKFGDPTKGIVEFPSVSDDLLIEGNAIWNVNNLTGSADVCGINVYAERAAGVIGTMSNPTGLLKGVSILNNTVILDNTTKGNVFGIGIQNTNSADLFNNAVKVINGGTSNISSGLFIVGLMPLVNNVNAVDQVYATAKGSVESNYNVIYTSSTIDAVRFIERAPMQNADEEWYSALLNSGSKGEYTTMRQWNAWTGQDILSGFGKDFTKDFTITATDMTIKAKPEGSPLNNRGKLLDGVHYDIHGLQRGQAEERYDIGAVEFIGKTNNVDFEATIITSPMKYRENSGNLSDAEYMMTAGTVPVSAIIRNIGTTQEENIAVFFKLFRETKTGWLQVSDYTTKVRSNSEEYAYVNVPNWVITPETYAELDESVPYGEFFKMEENVTPRYRLDMIVGDDQNTQDNKVSQYYRFYVMRAKTYKMLQSNNLMVPDPDAVAGDLNLLASTLNASAVEKSLRDITLYNVSRQLAEANKLADKTVDIAYRQDVDYLNRLGWPTRSIDYTMFKSVIYSDGNNTMLNRYEKQNIIKFIHSGTELTKKNFVMGSEEFVRNEKLDVINKGIDPDINLSSEFRLEPRYPYSPLGLDKQSLGGRYADYSGKTVTGVSVSGHNTYMIEKSGHNSDTYPQPGLFNLVTDGDGRVQTAFKYDELLNPDFPEEGRIMGGAFTSVSRNILYLGVDWRNFDKVEDIVRGGIDFLNRNGGVVNPVEIYTFTAEPVGQRVELNWSTASEQNSLRFEVERALVSGSDLNYAKVGEVPAVGNSSTIHYYGLTDNKVQMNNRYSYRLKMMDADGKYDYSNAVEVSLIGTGGIELGNVLPSPVRSSSDVTITLTEASAVSVEMFNSTGTLVKTLHNGQLPSGTTTLTINSSDFASGSYTLVVRSGATLLNKNITIVK
ncbi:MAG: GEVED domain-containing protein [bacterium]